VGRNAIVLAAGHGTRMKSNKHKVLHEVCGKPMITHILDELLKLKLDRLVVVVGQHRESVEAVVGDKALTVFQSEQLGTGHAVQCAMPALDQENGTTVVLYGDAPLIRAETIERLFAEREAKNASAVVLTANVTNPFGLGRVLVDNEGLVEKIVEEKDASPEEKAITLINTGIYAFETSALKQSLVQLRPDNAQGEYYLTDTISILRSDNQAVFAVEIEDVEEIASVNDRVQLAQVESIMKRRLCEYWMRQGVTIIDPDQTYIGTDVVIGRDTTLLPGTMLEGNTVVGEQCVIGPNTRLTNTLVENGAKIEYAVVVDSRIGLEATVGPFAYIRPGSVVGARVKVGDFVELKNSTLGDDTKVSHLAYVGDATIGERVNIGCGVITVNYDGEKKHKTIVGNDSFIGSNVNLVAPVVVGDGAYVVAGSTITEDVPPDGFAIARERQTTKPNYVKAWKAKRNGQKY
jgi:bifunctional UDP-N-acetylglucosamine pyrophosphorylase / glucosamine-1-phosphate N-acetyltransferase